MEFAYNVLGVLHVVLCFVLVIFILFQKSKGDGLFASSGSGNPFMSGVEVANFLTKTTKYLAILFLINTLILASLSVKIAKKNSVIEEAPESITANKSAVPTTSK